MANITLSGILFFQTLPLDDNTCETLNYTMLLLRNILFIQMPENQPQETHEPHTHITIVRYKRSNIFRSAQF